MLVIFRRDVLFNGDGQIDGMSAPKWQLEDIAKPCQCDSSEDSRPLTLPYREPRLGMQ